MYRLSKIRTSARTSSPREDNDHFPSARWASSSEEPELLQAQRPFSSYVRMDIVLEQIQVLWFESNRVKMEMSRGDETKAAIAKLDSIRKQEEEAERKSGEKEEFGKPFCSNSFSFVFRF